MGIQTARQGSPRQNSWSEISAFLHRAEALTSFIPVKIPMFSSLFCPGECDPPKAGEVTENSCGIPEFAQSKEQQLGLNRVLREANSGLREDGMELIWDEQPWEEAVCRQGWLCAQG